jgi:hypothetical protein
MASVSSRLDIFAKNILSSIVHNENFATRPDVPIERGGSYLMIRNVLVSNPEHQMLHLAKFSWKLKGVESTRFSYN